MNGTYLINDVDMRRSKARIGPNAIYVPGTSIRRCSNTTTTAPAATVRTMNIKMIARRISAIIYSSSKHRSNLTSATLKEVFCGSIISL